MTAGDSPPDPSVARSWAQFAERLRLLYRWAGEPSYRDLVRGAKRGSGPDIAITTVGNLLAGTRKPTRRTVIGFVTACGVDPGSWEAAWHRLTDQERAWSTSARRVGPDARCNRARYWATVRKIGDRCPDRGDLGAHAGALARLPRDGGGYVWIVGPMWAGKTTLAARLAIDPPADVDVVVFFVSRSRSTRMADYREAVGTQLALLVEQPAGAGTEHDLDHLWTVACERAEATGRRFVLIVDGLDEDDHHRLGEPSIAGQLPETCPPGCHVLVTSRRRWDIPDDVLVSHPLRRAVRSHMTPSPAARASKEAALADLRRHLEQPAERQLLGLLGTSGGWLCVRDLARLAEQDPDDVRVRLDGMSRVLESQTTFSVTRFALAHELLVTTVTGWLQPSTVTGLWSRIERWCAEYGRQGWPPGTPDYLLDRYAGQLRRRGDLNALVALHDPRRYHRQWSLTGANRIAIQEIGDTIDLIGKRAPDRVANMIRLGMWREHLRTESAQASLKTIRLWCRLGEFDKAEHLAAGSDAVWNAIAAVAEEALVAGQLHRVQALLPQLRNGIQQAVSPHLYFDFPIDRLVSLAMDRREGDLALDLATLLPLEHRVQSLITICQRSAADPDCDPFTSAWRQAITWMGTAARSYDADRVRSLAGIGDDGSRATRVGQMIGALSTGAATGDHIAIVREVARLANECDPSQDASQLVELTADQARTTDDPQQKLDALLDVAAVACEAGRTELASALLDEAIEVARTCQMNADHEARFGFAAARIASALDDPRADRFLDWTANVVAKLPGPERDWTVGRLAEAAISSRLADALSLLSRVTRDDIDAARSIVSAARRGLSSRAREAVRGLLGPTLDVIARAAGPNRFFALTDAAYLAIELDDLTLAAHAVRAAYLARPSTEKPHTAHADNTLLDLAVRARLLDVAVDLTKVDAPPTTRTTRLVAAGELAADLGEPELAADLIGRAVHAVVISESGERISVSLTVAGAAIRAGMDGAVRTCLAAAEAAARESTYSDWRERFDVTGTLGGRDDPPGPIERVAQAAIAAGRFALATEIIGMIESDDVRAELFAGLADAAVRSAPADEAASWLDRAQQAAAAVWFEPFRAEVLVRLAGSAVEFGDTARAVDLLDAADAASRRSARASAPVSVRGRSPDESWLDTDDGSKREANAEWWDIRSSRGDDEVDRWTPLLSATTQAAIEQSDSVTARLAMEAQRMGTARRAAAEAAVRGWAAAGDSTPIHTFLPFLEPADRPLVLADAIAVATHDSAVVDDMLVLAARSCAGLSSGFDTMRAWAAMARAAALAGRLPQAVQMLGRLQDADGGPGGWLEVVPARCAVLVAAATAGDDATVQRMVTELDHDVESYAAADPWHVGRAVENDVPAFGAACRAIAAAGRPAAAAALLQRVAELVERHVDRFRRSSTLAELATSGTAPELSDAVSYILTRAFDLVMAEWDSWTWYQGADQVLAAAVRCGQADSARNMWNDMAGRLREEARTDRPQRTDTAARALRGQTDTVLKTAAQLDMFIEAEQLLDELSESSIYADIEALERLAVAAAGADPARVDPLISRIAVIAGGQEFFTDRALAHAAPAAARHGRLDDARAIISRISDPKTAAETTTRVVSTATRAGRAHETMDLLDKVEQWTRANWHETWHGQPDPYLVLRVAQAALDAGLNDRAERLVALIVDADQRPNMDWRSHALATFIWQVSPAHPRLAWAVLAAVRIHQPAARQPILDASIAHGDLELARRLIAESIDDDVIPMPQAARLDRAVTPTVVHTVTELREYADRGP